ncbi:MAG: hypothetical protein QGF03_12190, partial [SAR324 cluster bacterium]|nr:hypothetical protein [SAR324 cluster bacterium]
IIFKKEPAQCGGYSYFSRFFRGTTLKRETTHWPHYNQIIKGLTPLLEPVSLEHEALRDAITKKL